MHSDQPERDANQPEPAELTRLDGSTFIAAARGQRALAAAMAFGLVAACSRGASDAPPRGADSLDSSAPLTVYTAASITRPVRAVLDSFTRRTGVRYAQESAASLELVRRITEVHAQPDVVALADPELFSRLLEPKYVAWHALFGRNRIVIAYTPRSRGAADIGPGNWIDVVTRAGTEVGRADPNTDPSGYRTLLVWQLAARYYRMPDLEARMFRAAPPRNVRPREADQVALLQTGELDYIWTYESLAALMGLRVVKLPDAVDLGNPGDSAAYAGVSTRVLGKTPGDTITIRGAPISFGVTVPLAAPHRAAAERFVAFLLSGEGRAILRRERFDALDTPIFVGRAPGPPSSTQGPL